MGNRFHKIKNVYKIFSCFAITAIVLPCGAHAANPLATYNGGTVTVEHFKKSLQNLNDDQRDALNKDERNRRAALDNVLSMDLLYVAAKKAGLENSAEFKEAADLFERQYLSTLMMQKYVEPKLVRSGIKKFFEENKNFFDTTQICAHHIILKDEAVAQKLAQQGQQKGIDFEKLAVDNSLEPSVKESKGDLGCFTREKMVPEFTSIVFQMRKGEVRGPIRSPFGYHVVKVDDIKVGRVPNFDEIEQRVKDTYRLRLVNDMVVELKKTHNVKINDDAVRSLKL